MRRSTASSARPDEVWDATATACAALGDRLVRTTGSRLIGLWPIRGATVLPLAIRLASGVAQLRGEPAATVCTEASGPPPPIALSRAPGLARFGRAELDGGRVTLWMPERAIDSEEIGAALVEMETILTERARRSVIVLVDLTGLLRLGHHLAALERLGGFCLVAQTGRARESDLIAVRDSAAADKLLGVVLVD